MWGLLSKYGKFLSILHKLKENCAPEIILLCETFLVDMRVPLCEFKENNKELVNRQNHANDGVAILVCKNLSYTPRFDLLVFQEEFFESCFTELESKMLIT